ncbi:ABC transporter substrate-binding protein [Paenibacillus sp. N1-5-1-14]|uniref:ABC transporter substrate-binding protein n=1 Tax=Paenibacillus radicibacter TaxID=2972488 RepID=UPI002158F2BD|nr:ABC transporter substrate-binding protein [Paenibacillus radicibacter]MCR8643064.1 ABC transporter substrate-binding protein [Paenibacillus radicibacter]
MKQLVVTKKLLIGALAMTMGAGLAACGSKTDTAATTSPEAATPSAAPASQQPSQAPTAKPVTLKFPIWSTITQDIFTKLKLVEEYKKVKPNVTIELELLKDTEFENTMKIRNAASELPDILPLKPGWLLNFKDNIIPLDDLKATQNNLFAKEYAIDGKVYGIPQDRFNEFVWYRKSVFTELNLQVPKTWDQFIETAQKIKASGKYTPILMGGKDGWPDYPFNEFMPALEGGDGHIWNSMAAVDEPFSKDQPFYKSYTKIKKLYDAKVMGKDPLGIGWDQAKAAFGAKQGAMIASGQWFVSDVEKMMNGDMSDIGTFLLPVREKETDKLNTITMVDSFYTIPKVSKNQQEAKEFLEWYFSKDWYTKLMTESKIASTMKDINIDLGATFKAAYEGVDVNYVVYAGTNETYKKIESATKFDVKKMGQDMMAGKDFEKMMTDMNKQWKDAKSKIK